MQELRKYYLKRFDGLYWSTAAESYSYVYLWIVGFYRFGWNRKKHRIRWQIVKAKKS